VTRPEDSAAPGEHEGAGETAAQPGAAPAGGSVAAPDDGERTTSASSPAARSDDAADPAASADTATGDARAGDAGADDAAAGDAGADDAGADDAAAGDAGADDAGAGDAAAAGGRRSSRWVPIALAGGLLLLVVVAVTLALLWRGNVLDERARDQALTAARQSAINLTSIDQEDFDGDVGRVLDGATGEFRTDFSGRVAQLQELVEENEVSAEGRVLEAGLVRADRESATALVVVDSRVRNTAVPEGRVNSYRMRLELEKVGDEWRTSSLEFVG